MGLLSKLFGSKDAGYSVGDVISFGPFQWRILNKWGDEALIITEDVIDCMWYQRPLQRYDIVRWEECSLRRYLNKDFIENNFTDEQSDCMRLITIHNDPDPFKEDEEIDTTLDTQDTVFCLSVSQAWAYFEKPSARRAKASDYAVDAGVRVNADGCCAWWLRSNLTLEDGAYVTSGGAVTSNWVNSASEYGVGIRPAMIINLSDYKKLSDKTSKRYRIAAKSYAPVAKPKIANPKAEADKAEESVPKNNVNSYSQGTRKAENRPSGETKEFDGATQLFMAAYAGDHLEVERLLAMGADPNERSFVNWGEHELEVYSSRVANLDGDISRLPDYLLLRSREPVMALNLIKDTLSRSMRVRRSFRKPELGITTIYYPAHNNDCETLRLLLEAGADPNGTIVNGLFPLYVAAERGNLEAVRLLVDAGADVDKQTPMGATALLNAADEGQLDVVRLLIAAGADRSIANNAGVTPRMAAGDFGYYQIVEVLDHAVVTQERFYRSVTRTLAALRYYQENFEYQTNVYQRLGLRSARLVISKIENVMAATCSEMGERTNDSVIEEKVWALTVCPTEVYDRNDLVACPLLYLDVLTEDAKDFTTNQAVIRTVENAHAEFRNIAMAIDDSLGDIDYYIERNMNTYITVGITLDHIISNDIPGHSMDFRDYVMYADEAHQREMNQQ